MKNPTIRPISISRRDFVKSAAAVGAAAFGMAPWFRARAASGAKPNIIFMVADNLGRESVGFYKDDAALFGKWNQGYAEKFSAVHQGFDEFYGSNAGNADYYTHVYGRDKRRHFYRNLTPINDEGYFDRLFTDEAIKYLQKRKENPKPFYLNLTFYAPHGPCQTPPGYEHSDDRMVNYKHMIQYLDSCVDRVLDEVKRLGMTDNTLIVFLSDQGASTLNNFKRNLAEGGLKVVCNALGPGRIPANKRIATPWLHLDLYAVFAGLAAAAMPQDRVMDARDVWPLFAGKEQTHDRTFYWTYRDEDAVRIGDLKLRMKGGTVFGLFNLAADPNEEQDLAPAQPGDVAKMRTMHTKWKAECKAQQTSTA